MVYQVVQWWLGKGVGMPGDYANMSEIEGNYDLLEDWEDKTDFVDAQDESTWPIFLRRQCAGYPIDIYRDCGECFSENIVTDEYRGEAYCQDCGMVQSESTRNEGYEIELDPLENVKVEEDLTETSRWDGVHWETHPAIIHPTPPDTHISESGDWIELEYEHPLTREIHTTKYWHSSPNGSQSRSVENPEYAAFQIRRARSRVNILDGEPRRRNSGPASRANRRREEAEKLDTTGGNIMPPV
jgi:hypothetical protein